MGFNWWKWTDEEDIQMCFWVVKQDLEIPSCKGLSKQLLLVGLDGNGGFDEHCSQRQAAGSSRHSADARCQGRTSPTARWGTFTQALPSQAPLLRRQARRALAWVVTNQNQKKNWRKVKGCLQKAWERSLSVIGRGKCRGKWKYKTRKANTPGSPLCCMPLMFLLSHCCAVTQCFNCSVCSLMLNHHCFVIWCIFCFWLLVNTQLMLARKDIYVRYNCKPVIM